MRKIDIEDSYSIYWWIIRHLMLMDIESNQEILKKGYIELDGRLQLVNHDFKYFSMSKIVSSELIVNCMLGNYPKGYCMLDSLIKLYN